MSDVPAIDVKQLRKKYSEGWFGRKGFTALKGIDLRVEGGEVFGLLGPNGAGKTTLIKTLLGIVRSTGGSAEVLGFPAGSRAARRKIGYLPENLNFAAHHTATRALQLYGRLSGLNESTIRTRGGELLEMVGLAGRDKGYVRKFSKGMRQRLGLAQALLHEPELMIMDEPTDGLDPVGRSEIRQIITELKSQGKTIFLNSHILQEVELTCDRVAILAGGTLRGIGTPAELTQQFHGSGASRLRTELVGTQSQIGSLRQSIEQRLPDLEVAPLPDNHWQLTANVESQSAVNQLTDDIRAAGLGIHNLQRTELTLEEVFLSAVADVPPPTIPPELAGSGVMQAETLE